MLLVLGDDVKTNLSSYLIYTVILKRCVDILQQSGYLYGEVLELGGIVKSINSLFELPTKAYELADGSRKFTGVKDKIKVNGLSFNYASGEEIIHDASFEIGSGEVVALVGPSGSGKSTVAQLLLRLYDSEPGMISIDGFDIQEYSLQDLREKTAYVSQSSNLFDDTLRNNLTYGITRSVTDEELLEAIEKAQLKTFFSSLKEGFETRVGDKGIRISGGEAQRVAIARGILKNVGFLILDEATSALDATTEREIQQAIDLFVENKTVLVIAHRFSTLKNVDKIVAIADGRVVEQGSLAELLDENGLFAELWKAQELFV
ncbi:UNVERIFIED_CONTAM: hypothetical protein GTU68_038682 [Idotea baltica]|nr:hypothetical protein [Idotea baltica]